AFAPADIAVELLEVGLDLVSLVDLLRPGAQKGLDQALGHEAVLVPGFCHVGADKLLRLLDRLLLKSQLAPKLGDPVRVLLDRFAGAVSGGWRRGRSRTLFRRRGPGFRRLGTRDLGLEDGRRPDRQMVIEQGLEICVEKMETIFLRELTLVTE